ncbi:MAG: sigma-70 family RNA polymerase sigma factor [Cyclobacteriaceae bacterium]|nr:sigma-70 family RNA polymerase sigma factor [Cyclobacteriaceae bacterium]
MKYQEDRFYIDKVLKGNLPSYAILIEKYKRLAFTLALRIVKNHEDAEEVTQDAFLKAFRALDTFKQESRFSTWLYKIVYHTSLSRLRKKNPESIGLEEISLPDALQETTPDGLDIMHLRERKKIISTAIDRLKEDEAAVMTLFYLHENSIKEIGEITGYSDSNIKILLFRGRKKLVFELKKILKEDIVDIL